MGIELKKEWVATLDNRTRHAHAMADGQVVAVDKPFKLDGYDLMFPGDKSAPGYLVYNCRCTTIAAFKDYGKDAKRRSIDGVGEDMTYQEWAEKKEQLKSAAINGKISSPINSRNTARGKPQAISIFGEKLNKRQQKLLDYLPEVGASKIVPKKSVSMKDLSALTANTGHEFAMFTKHGERLIVRGNETHVNITVEKAKQLFAAGYKWSGHTHPGEDELTKMASYGDIEVLKAFRQRKSVIYDSLGRHEVFGIWK